MNNHEFRETVDTINRLTRERDAALLQLSEMREAVNRGNIALSGALKTERELEASNRLNGELKKVSVGLADVLNGGYHQGDNGLVVGRRQADEAVKRYAQLAIDAVNDSLAAEKRKCDECGEVCNCVERPAKHKNHLCRSTHHNPGWYE